MKRAHFFVEKTPENIETFFPVLKQNIMSGFSASADANPENPSAQKDERDSLAIPMLDVFSLGNKAFMDMTGSRLAYMAGAMANGISSADMVIALGEKGLLGSFGCAGLSLDRIVTEIDRIQSALPRGPYCFNLIHNRSSQQRELDTVALFIEKGVRLIEASAFMDITKSLVYYRAKGLSMGEHGEITIGNRIIVKLSRIEIAEKMLQPAPQHLLNALVEEGMITQEQLNLAAEIPLVDAITVEADSGGHTDKQQLATTFPEISDLRSRYQAEHILVGAAGGMATPAAVQAAFSLGADYIVTGSVNQSCIEAGTSAQVKSFLSQAKSSDVSMAPAADMFELGVQVQVLKSGSLYPMRAAKFYQLYKDYSEWNAIPEGERNKLQSSVFKQTFEQVWEQTQKYLAEHEPEKLALVSSDKKRQLAYVFRWYLGQSSSWAISGNAERTLDYQVWCGPSMGAFNQWVKGSYLENVEQRSVTDIAILLMSGAVWLTHLYFLRLQGLQVSSTHRSFSPSAEWISAYLEQCEAQDSKEEGQERVEDTASPSNSVENHYIPQKTAHEIQQWLTSELSSHLNLPAPMISTEDSFESFGLSSKASMLLVSKLETWLGQTLSPTLVWNYPNIQSLSIRLSEQMPAQQASAELQATEEALS